MAYVDGFVVPVEKKNLARYKKMARAAGKVWREHGALEFMECVADDVPFGKRTSYPRAVKLKKTEVVVIAHIVYKSRAHRDKVLAKVFADERLKKTMKGKPPFDPKRFFWGGFKPIVSL